MHYASFPITMNPSLIYSLVALPHSYSPATVKPGHGAGRRKGNPQTEDRRPNVIQIVRTSPNIIRPNLIFDKFAEREFQLCRLIR